MKKYLTTNWPFAVIFFIMVIACWPFFIQGSIPVAGDILLGQYHPWLDLKWDNYSTVFPVLNNTIADSIFSFYPWKFRSIEMLKAGIFPLYDPSTYMGSSLFATGTTGLLYPLNILFFFFDFNFVWGIISSSTIFLSASFFYIWLKGKKLEKLPVLIGSIAYAFSAFIGLQITFINTAHSVLWLPLILFAIDKLFEKFSFKFFILLILSLFSSLNAGFFQGSLYIFVTALAYALFNLGIKKNVKKVLIIAAGFLFPVLLSAIQILPFLEAVKGSSRLANYGSAGQESEIFNFFVEAKFFLTTFFPDFFGNPGKGNYYMQPGYYEFNNFAGTVAVIGAVIGFTLIKKQKDILFFSIVLFLTIIFASANPLSKIPYQLSLPVISSLVPARLLAISQFSLLVIAAYGLNLVYFCHLKLKKYLLITIPLLVFYLSVLVIAFLNFKEITGILVFPGVRWETGFRNSILPVSAAGSISILIFAYLKYKKNIFFVLVLLITCFELIRQTSYFRPFIKPELIYPKTATINFLEQNLKGNRFMITYQDLIPTNSQLIYNFKIVDGEGPIYPKKYGEFVAAINYDDFTDELPQYKRMIYFRNPDTKLLGLLNIKYLAALNEIKNPSLKLVLQEGETKIYENTTLLPRVWSVTEALVATSPLEAMKLLVSKDFNPATTAVVSNPEITKLKLDNNPIKIENFTQNGGEIRFNTTGSGEKLLVVSEQYNPNWSLFIDGEEDKALSIDYNLLGLYLPAGEHEILFKFHMKSFDQGKIISLGTFFALVVLVIILRASYFKKKN